MTDDQERSPDGERVRTYPWAEGDPMPGSGMEYMLPVGVLLAFAVCGLVAFNVMSDHHGTTASSSQPSQQTSAAPPPTQKQ